MSPSRSMIGSELYVNNFFETFMSFRKRGCRNQILEEKSNYNINYNTSIYVLVFCAIMTHDTSGLLCGTSGFSAETCAGIWH